MKYKVGDKVYGKPVLAVWQGTITEVVTEWGDPYYIVKFDNWGECARRECELFRTEKQAIKYL